MLGQNARSLTYTSSSTVRYDPANPKVRFLANFFYYSGECNEPEAQMQIKRNFLAIRKQPFLVPLSKCGQNAAKCTIENVIVYCGEAAAPVRRRRRSVKEVYIKVDFLAKEKAGTHSTFKELKNVSDLGNRNKLFVKNTNRVKKLKGSFIKERCAAAI